MSSASGDHEEPRPESETSACGDDHEVGDDHVPFASVPALATRFAAAGAAP